MASEPCTKYASRQEKVLLYCCSPPPPPQIRTQILIVLYNHVVLRTECVVSYCTVKCISASFDRHTRLQQWITVTYTTVRDDQRVADLKFALAENGAYYIPVTVSGDHEGLLFDRPRSFTVTVYTRQRMSKGKFTPSCSRWLFPLNLLHFSSNFIFCSRQL